MQQLFWRLTCLSMLSVEIHCKPHICGLSRIHENATSRILASVWRRSSLFQSVRLPRLLLTLRGQTTEHIIGTVYASDYPIKRSFSKTARDDASDTFKPQRMAPKNSSRYSKAQKPVANVANA